MDFSNLIEEAKNDNRFKAGRPNKSSTINHYEEHKKSLREFRHTPQPDNYNNEIIQAAGAEVLNPDIISDYKELYKITCESILADFARDNPELIKRHPYNYYKQLLIMIRQNTPKITADDIDKAQAAWEVLTQFMESIGLYITYETFEKVTGIYKYQLRDREKLNTKYSEFLKKITNDCDSALINEIQYNPFNQTNKIFIAKVHGIIEKTEPKTIEVNHNISNFRNISKYRIEENGDK